MIVNILQKLQQSINRDFEITSDFDGWKPGKCDMSVDHNNMRYEIHYEFCGYKKIKAEVFAFENVPVNGKKRWFSAPVDQFLKGVIEGCFKHMILERFDSLYESEEDEKVRQERRIQDEIDMMETYMSLELYR